MADIPALSDFEPSLYRERWIAVVRGRVIGVGTTRSQAELAAKQIRPKDRPQLYFVDVAGNLQDSPPLVANPKPEQWLKNHPLLNQVVQILQAQQIESYLVGGAVRDFLLGRPNIVDLDFAVPGNGLRAARIVADALKASYYPLDEERSTGRAVCDQPGSTEKIFLDFAAFRGADLNEDLLDRDFTINAIALSLTGSPRLIDPANGQRDLNIAQIKMVTDNAFRHDPVRVIRAVRQAIDFGCDIEPQTAQAIQRDAALLPRISAERQRDELMKLLNTPSPGQAVRLLQKLGALQYVVPEAAAMVGVTQSAPHHLDVFNHTVLAMDVLARQISTGWPEIPPDYQTRVQNYLSSDLAGNLSLKKMMPLAVLLHDTGKPLTRAETEAGQVTFIGHEKESAEIAYKLAHRLRFSGQAVNFVETVVRQHMRPHWLAAETAVSRRAIFRFFRDTGGKGFEAGVAVALHALVDHAAIWPVGHGEAERQALLAVAQKLLADYFDRHEQLINPLPLLTGRDLIDQLGLKQGKLIGQLLYRLKEAQAVGEVSTPQQALEFVKTDPDFARYQAGESIRHGRKYHN